MTIQLGYPQGNALASRSVATAPLKPLGFEVPASPSSARMTNGEIAVVNAQIAAGTADFPTGSTIHNTTDNTVWMLTGISPSRQFAQSGGSVITQVPRTVSFNLSAIDNYCVIPVAAALSSTLLASAGLSSNFMAELLSVAAVPSVLLAGAGATLWLAGASVGSVTVNNKGSSIVVRGSGTANEFFATKIGI